MQPWLEKFRKEGMDLFQKGAVRDLEFSDATYQVEVYDKAEDESFWPFFQFDDSGSIKDAFCSCEAGEKGCPHLAAAYLKIFDGEKNPLHIRYERSLWNRLCRLLADHIGYEVTDLKKSGSRYLFKNDLECEITLKEPLPFFEIRPKETPENSLKFSNLSQEEILHWREGRPSKELRYILSFWSDFAKYLLGFEKKAVTKFEEDENGFPLLLTVTLPNLSLFVHLTLHDLKELIETLKTVKSSLKIFHPPEQKVKKMEFDPQKKGLVIEHEIAKAKKGFKPTAVIGRWGYISGKGFYPIDGKTLLSKNFISKEEIAEFLDQEKDEVKKWLYIHETKVSVFYDIYFDSEWKWHFNGYLFEKGDLEKLTSGFFKNWAYIEGKGFYPLENPLFDTPSAILPPTEVSKFVNHNRIWLSTQEGFQTHLSSIESHLSYSVTENRALLFFAKEKEAIDSKDFGDWIYYKKLGFFSKKHARLGFAVRPGVEVRYYEISPFIHSNKEELENIPNFFTPFLPIKQRGLEISIKSPTTLIVKPVDIADATHPFQIFGDYVYTEGRGFCELPPQMRLPEGFQNEVTITEARFHHFFTEDLPLLRKAILKIDPKLLPPQKVHLQVEYLVRTPGGDLKAELVWVTEHGRVYVTELHDAIEKKQRFLFSNAGLIDLQDMDYQWIQNLKSVFPETRTIELSILDFLKLDAMFNLASPQEDSFSAEISRNLLKELREFITHEKPNLKGLKSELRLYQQTGVFWLWFLYKNSLSGLLCDDMGLGKTHQAMALVASICNQKTYEKRRFLVVCPTSVIYHWQDKLAQFLPDVPIFTFHGLKRSLEKLPKEGIVLTTYGILRLEKKALKEIPFEAAFFDEVQVAKNPSSRVHQALLHINARMKVGLTGTPIENNLTDLKSLFDIVLPGFMPGPTQYRELFVTPIERDQDEEKKALLSSLIKPFILRRRKQEVLQELPEKSEDKSYCDLSEEQKSLYKETLERNREELIAGLRDTGQSVNYMHIFALLSRLKQVCDHPALIHKDPKNYKKYQSGKWDLFVELLEEARESEQKVVVFSQYLYMLDIIEVYLQEKGWGYAQIRGDTVNRREELRRFQEDPECVVFIGSLQAAGLGIDLTAASVVILYDRWWNAARENQAIDRVHRIGQKWGVQVFKLITKNTIEEKIDQMITRKGKLMEEVVVADDQSVLKTFSRSDLIELLTFMS